LEHAEHRFVGAGEIRNLGIGSGGGPVGEPRIARPAIERRAPREKQRQTEQERAERGPPPHIIGDCGGGAWRAIVSVPSVYGPSHVSAPESVPLTESAVMSVIVPLSVAGHAGVGSLDASAGNVAVQFKAVPEIVPESTPVLLR